MTDYYAKQGTNNEYASVSVNLLISILVRYPEIATIKFLPEDNSLKLTFLLTAESEPEDFSTARQFITSSIAAYHLLRGITPANTIITESSYEQMVIIDILRDVNSLSQNEITLLIQLLSEQYGERLIADYHDVLPEDELVVQDEFIADMLDNMKTQHLAHGLIGIREEGRVFVFDK